MHSYLNSPSPTIGFFAAGLSSAITIGTCATKAAAPAALINVLRDVLFMLVPLPQNAHDLSDATEPAQNCTASPSRMVELSRHSPSRAYNSPQPRPGGGTGRRTTLRW